MTALDLREKIIIALDVEKLKKALFLVEMLAPYVKYFKVNPQLLTEASLTDLVFLARSFRAEIFLDAKFNDIPESVGEMVKAASFSGVKILTVHASAGFEAMSAAVANKWQARILAVTALTSLDDNDCGLIFCLPRKMVVLRLARQAKLAGVDGVICAPQDLDVLWKEEFEGFLKVTPGIRPLWARADDHKLIMTPAEAICAGADMLVIGRPITRPPPEIGHPVDAFLRIAEEINSAFEGVSEEKK